MRKEQLIDGVELQKYRDRVNEARARFSKQAQSTKFQIWLYFFGSLLAFAGLIWWIQVQEVRTTPLASIGACPTVMYDSLNHLIVVNEWDTPCLVQNPNRNYRVISQ